MLHLDGEVVGTDVVDACEVMLHLDGEVVGTDDAM